MSMDLNGSEFDFETDAGSDLPQCIRTKDDSLFKSFQQESQVRQGDQP